jgi:hypothetical protein
MHHVKLITALTAAEIRALAHSAADRGEAHQEANPFDPATASAPHHQFAAAFHSRVRELALVS